MAIFHIWPNLTKFRNIVTKSFGHRKEVVRRVTEYNANGQGKKYKTIMIRFYSILNYKLIKVEVLQCKSDTNDTNLPAERRTQPFPFPIGKNFFSSPCQDPDRFSRNRIWPFEKAARIQILPNYELIKFTYYYFFRKSEYHWFINTVLTLCVLNTAIKDRF